MQHRQHQELMRQDYHHQRRQQLLRQNQEFLPQYHHPQQVEQLRYYHLQQPLRHPPRRQIEPPVFRGNLDETCRTIHVYNIHPQVREPSLQSKLSNSGNIEGFKLYRKPNLSYCFVTFGDRQSAARAIEDMNGIAWRESTLVVKWAPAFARSNETSTRFNIYVGGLTPDVNDHTLSKWFHHFKYPSVTRAKVVLYHDSDRSRGYGYVTFRRWEDANLAINECHGQTFEISPNREIIIECYWAAKGPEVDPQDDPHNTTVFVANLPPSDVTSNNLREYFTNFKVGTIDRVHVAQSGKIGFVRYTTHDEAARAIDVANNRAFFHKRIKCSWAHYQL